MIVAGIIIVLAWVPGVEIHKFHPLGFDFEADSQLSAWGLLLTVLIYYIARFGADCWTDYKIWYGTYSGNLREMKTNPGAARTNPASLSAAVLNKHFWFWDFSPPAIMAIIGAIAAITEIKSLIP